MFEGMLGRLVGGAIWGVGAGLALTLTRGVRGQTESGLRPVAKSLMVAYVATAERVREATAEAREIVEDLYAEAKAERQTESTHNGKAGESAETTENGASESDADRARQRHAPGETS